MGIPNSQLETWSHPGAQESAKRTHESIRTALEGLSWVGMSKTEYLQGSYKNRTNIYGNSDVDLVVEFNASWLFSYQEFFQYRQSVMNAIATRGRKSVSGGNKSIKVANSPLNADVVVCQRASNGSNECIRFFSQDGQSIVNYPQQHFDNGAKKNKTNGEKYKPTIRIFKNMREWLVKNRWIDSDLAPSYFVECLLFNVPDGYFNGRFEQTVPSIIDWLKQNKYGRVYKCQNQQTYLFGNGPDKWPQDNAIEYVNMLEGMWYGWRHL